MGAGTGLDISDNRIWNAGSSSPQRYKPYNLIRSLYFIFHFTSHIHSLKIFSKTYPCLLFPFQHHVPNYAVSPRGLFPFCVCVCVCARISRLSHVYYILHPHNALPFNHSNNIYREEHAMQLLVTQFSLVPCHSNSLRSKSSIPFFFSIKPTDALISQIYFCQENLHVSRSSSAHYQEFTTVHSALVYVMHV